MNEEPKSIQCGEHGDAALRQQLVFDAATVQATGTMLQRLQTIAGVGVLASLAFALLTSGAVLLAAVPSLEGAMPAMKN